MGSLPRCHWDEKWPAYVRQDLVIRSGRDCSILCVTARYCAGHALSGKQDHGASEQRVEQSEGEPRVCRPASCQVTLHIYHGPLVACFEVIPFELKPSRTNIV